MLSALVRSLRPAQWVKNLFVLAPLVFAHRLENTDLLLRALGAMALFCAASSAVYLFNDLRDRELDRLHPLKKRRPIASGELPVTVAAVAAVLLGLGTLLAAVPLGPRFLVALGAYLALNLLYTVALKNIVILDVMSIAAGFVLRILGGAAAIAVEVSGWLVLCGTFLALFLALAKRRHELMLMSDEARTQRRVLADYSPGFLDQMINVVTASTMISYALYTTDPRTALRLGTENLIWTLPLVLFGIFRFLYLLYQRPSEKNPTEAILTDWPFLANMALWSALVMALVYGF
ncbi:MAG TPA: decaprenyl-phosphate phosphoribosyltransferase [Thermoanaerobaculia bacterium]|nr:decaprenyl-phosphate phosphoribosyltransferase [Thermoanaerobaculia bacterium]